MRSLFEQIFEKAKKKKEEKSNFWKIKNCKIMHIKLFFQYKKKDSKSFILYVTEVSNIKKKK